MQSQELVYLINNPDVILEAGLMKGIFGIQSKNYDGPDPVIFITPFGKSLNPKLFTNLLLAYVRNRKDYWRVFRDE